MLSKVAPTGVRRFSWPLRKLIERNEPVAVLDTPNHRMRVQLSDDVTKPILTVADEHRMTTQALESHCDASLASIYRRIEELLELGLLRERMEPQSDGTTTEGTKRTWSAYPWS